MIRVLLRLPLIFNLTQKWCSKLKTLVIQNDLTCHNLLRGLSYTPLHSTKRILPRLFLLANTCYDHYNVSGVQYGSTNCICHHINCTLMQLAYVSSIEAFWIQVLCLLVQLPRAEPYVS